jgi:dipeptidyl-peptidase-4
MIPRTLFTVAGALALAVPLHAQQPALTVDAIWGSDTFAGDRVSVAWMRDGRYYTVTEPSDSGGTNLYRVDARTGDRELLVGPRDLMLPGRDAPMPIDEYEFSSDGRTLLVLTDRERIWRRSFRGTYYVLDLASRRLTPVSRDPAPQLAAKLSPNGRTVGFVRDHDLFVTDLATGAEVRLTADGSDDVLNGIADWVYEEELSLWDAFRFSPDGARIAFWRFDQSPIRTFHLLDEMQLYPEPIPVRYPKAGVANSRVRIGVVEIATGATTWVELGSDEDAYVAEMGFTESELWLTTLNRHQNRLDLLLADPRTGDTRVILTETDSAWVDATTPMWLDGGARFLFRSARDGWEHLYVFDRDGRLRRQVTHGPWDVTGVFGVDEARDVAYFTGSMDGPLHRPLYRVGLDGGAPRRLSARSGWHGADFDPTYATYVHTESSAHRPPTQTLRQADGTALRTLSDNTGLRTAVEALDLRSPEFMTVPAADGTELNAYVIKPRDFDSTRTYPLLIYVYGGPGSQTVTDAWGGSRYLWHQMLANDGVLVASVDNRGTGARGRRFEKQTYLRLGQLESDDQIAAARHLGALPYVDAERIGIWGWSYGGYMTLLSLFRGSDVFAAGLSVAPVTDWRLYDTIYTERFMRTPQENPEGYDRGAPLTYADRLAGHLLVVHGTGDDNVHAQNTVQLVERLENAGKQFDMRIYPNKAHAIDGARTRVNLYGMFTAWIYEHLGGGGRLAP